jgi:propanol-preferring alcohol dehydrogenase
VVVIGAGGLGLMAIEVLKALGGKGAIVVDIDPVKREAALAAGALQAIDARAPDAVQQVQRPRAAAPAPCSTWSAPRPPSARPWPAQRAAATS